MATSIHDILAELRSYSFDERDKGDRFERLMQAYLTTKPQYQQLYRRVSDGLCKGWLINLKE
jgi:predicted helicase